MQKEIKQNSVQAWFLAARPKTLTGAAVPVMMGLALAWASLQSQLSTLNSRLSTLDSRLSTLDSRLSTLDSRLSTLDLIPAILCVLFAFLMQIDANFVNDYFDWKKGTDDEHRLGPRRACAQGWVTPKAMVVAIGLTSVAACITGLPLIWYGGVMMLWIGLACVVGCFLYTLLLSYIGLGDILVLLFFGIVPVCTTFYLQTGTIPQEVLVSSIACGLVIDTLLVVNNYRDRDNDRRVGKRTLVVLIGEQPTEYLFFGLGLAAFLLGLIFFFKGQYFTFLLPFIYLVLHAGTYRQMVKIKHGKALNNVLAVNARNMLLYGLLFSLGVILDTLV